jgi:hypothetical protein
VEALLMLSGRPGAVKGKVSTADGSAAIGAPVYVYPLDPELRSRTGGMRSGRTDQNGEFHIAGLPPGRYEVLSSFSVSEAEEAGWGPGRGKAVQVEENADERVELVLGQDP